MTHIHPSAGKEKLVQAAGPGEPLRIEVIDKVLWLTLNRPDKRNALNRPLLEGLVDALQRANQDPEIHVIVIAAEGSGFCAGADVGEIRADPSAMATRKRIANTVALHKAVAEVCVPVLAAVSGPAVGGGATFALAADGILVSESATFSFPELKHGVPPYLVAPLLTRQLGRIAAFELLSRGAPVGAAAAVARGWVNAAHPVEQLHAEVAAWAAQIALYPRETLSGIKRLLRIPNDLSTADALADAVRLYEPLL